MFKLFSVITIIILSIIAICVCIYIIYNNKQNNPNKSNETSENKNNFTKTNTNLDNQLYKKPPVFVINTNGLQLNYNSAVRNVQDVGKMSATLNVYDPQNINSNPIVDNINIIFTGHGASTRDLPKTSYGIKFKDPAIGKVSLCGFPKSDKYVLYGPVLDPAIIRTPLNLLLANQLGFYSPRSQFVELFLIEDNKVLSYENHYKGIYALLETVQIGKDNINISKDGIVASSNWWNKAEGPAIWLDGLNHENNFSYQNYFTTYAPGIQAPEAHIPDKNYPYFPYIGGPSLGGQGIKQEHPSSETSNTAIFKKFLQEFQNVLFNDKIYLDDKIGYKKYINVESFVDNFILKEISNDPDGYRHNNYMTFDNNILSMAYIWDCDLGFGNVTYALGAVYDTWRFQFYNNILGNLIANYPGRYYLGTSVWYSRLWTDPYFRNLVYKRWKQLRQPGMPLSDSNIKSIVDFYFNYLTQDNKLSGNNFISPLKTTSIDRNFDRWPGSLSGVEYNGDDCKKCYDKNEPINPWNDCCKQPAALNKDMKYCQNTYPEQCSGGKSGSWCENVFNNDCNVDGDCSDGDKCVQVTVIGPDNVNKTLGQCGSSLISVIECDNKCRLRSDITPDMSLKLCKKGLTDTKNYWNAWEPIDPQSTRPIKDFHSALYETNGKLHAEGSALLIWLNLRLKWMDSQLYV